MFELDWPTEVLDELADIWVTASPADRDHIGAGIERLNRALVRDPFEVGESRSDPFRVTFEAGLSISFSVVAYKVRVVNVRRPERRSE